MYSNSSLILEGGGMRGVYTGGLLEFFMEKNLYFPYVIGVSAGACNAMSYLSRQKGRNKKITVDLAGDKRYMRKKGIIDGTGFFNMDFLFDEIPNKLIKYDYKRFRETEEKLVIVATDCKTGEPIYLDVTRDHDNEEICTMLRATSSLPLLAPVVKYKGMELLDGGLSDSIPIQKVISEGFMKNVVVLTRNKGYRKQQTKTLPIYKLLYNKKYSGAIKGLENRYSVYNHSLDEVERLTEEGKVYPIYPSEQINVSRVEKDKSKLEYLYQLGYYDGEAHYNHIIEYLSEVDDEQQRKD